MLTIPSILDIPAKLNPVITCFDAYRWFLLEGGRGSGKSNTVARLILYLCDKYSLRVVCGREIQASIEESVYTLLADLIRALGLSYRVGAKKIEHVSSGSVITFHGFREQGSVNIKGLEGVDILWVDEAQAITKSTLDVIIPTIRKKNSKIFWSMNRHLRDDPVYVEFKGREDCLAIHIDYFENPHCPDVSKVEAEKCKNRNISDYNHIWLGEPLAQANNAAFRNVTDVVQDYEYPIAYDSAFEYVMGVDLAKSVDYTVLTVINKQMKRVDYLERMENENRSSWNYQKEKILAVSKMYGRALTIVDSTGVGDPIVEDLTRMGCNIFYNVTEAGKETSGVKFTASSKENLVEKLKVAIELKLITIPRDKNLITELEGFEAVTMPTGKVRYQARDGEHDDMVVSLALAVWGARDMIYGGDYVKPKTATKGEEFWKIVKADVVKRDFGRQGYDVEYDILEDAEILIE